MNEDKSTPVTEETKITIRFWVIVGLILSALLGLSATAWTHRERIIVLETATVYTQKTQEKIEKGIEEIKCDLKEHIKETRNGRK